ncbi:hypothetical protein SCA6_000332 [Theobroma cacao]
MTRTNREMVLELAKQLIKRLMNIGKIQGNKSNVETEKCPQINQGLILNHPRKERMPLPLISLHQEKAARQILLIEKAKLSRSFFTLSVIVQCYATYLNPYAQNRNPNPVDGGIFAVTETAWRRCGTWGNSNENRATYRCMVHGTNAGTPATFSTLHPLRTETSRPRTFRRLLPSPCPFGTYGPG